MRLLWALSVAQTLAILFLTGKVLSVAGERPAVGAKIAPRAGEPSPGPLVRYAGCACPDADQLRTIVTEELQAQDERNAEAVQAAEAEKAAGAPERPSAPEQLAQVEQEIERHIRIGAINDMDMMRLQASIARLDQAGRRRMLGKLVKAMNGGLLQGRF